MSVLNVRHSGKLASAVRDNDHRELIQVDRRVSVRIRGVTPTASCDPAARRCETSRELYRFVAMIQLDRAAELKWHMTKKVN